MRFHVIASKLQDEMPKLTCSSIKTIEYGKERVCLHTHVSVTNANGTSITSKLSGTDKILWNYTFKLSVEGWLTRGLKGHISWTWVQCATFVDRLARAVILFFYRPEKHKLGRGRRNLASYQVSFNSIQRFQRSKKMYISANNRPGWPSWFFNWPEKHKRPRGPHIVHLSTISDLCC